MRWFAVVVLGGCSGNVQLPTDSGSPTNPNTNCDGAQDFHVGIAATSDLTGLTAAISQATPSPPDVGDNTWTLTVDDAMGAPAEGLTIVVSPWMPLHGHGLVPADYGATETEPGSYDVDLFHLTMPGLWEFPIDLGTAEAPDPVVFRFCAQG